MEAAKIAAIGVVAGILALTLKKTRPEIAMQVSIAAGIIIFLITADYLRSAVSFVRDFAEKYGGLYDSVTVVLKIVGIAYLCEFAIQILKDIGEGSIASKVELGGKLVILVLTLPVMRDFAEVVLGLLS